MAELSARYGKALYDLAVEQGNVDQCLDQAVLVRDVLEKPDAKRILEHPHISRAEKRAFLQRVFAGTLAGQLEHFLDLIIAKRREAIMADALTEFIRLSNRRRGLVEAEVVSAIALREEQVSALRDLIAKKMGKQVQLTCEVDPTLMGGFYLLVDGYCMDRTVKKRLQDMKLEMGRG